MNENDFIFNSNEILNTCNGQELYQNLLNINTHYQDLYEHDVDRFDHYILSQLLNAREEQDMSID
jgi:hypothetical protein